MRVSCCWTRILAYPSGVACTEMITGWLHVLLSKHGAGDAWIEVSLLCCGHVQAPWTLRSEEARSRGHTFAKSLGGVGKACLWPVVQASSFPDVFPSQLRCCRTPSKAALCWLFGTQSLFYGCRVSPW